MEMEKRLDRRVLKTKRAIRNAFVRLLADKEIEKITVKEVADNADVDRKTVYNYYNGVYEILEELENELVALFEAATENFSYEKEGDEGIFFALTEFLNNNLEIFSLLMKIDERSRFIEKIIEYLRERIKKAIIDSDKNIPLQKVDLATEYVASGIFSAYRYWFNSERKQPLASVSRELARLVLGGLPAYFTAE